MDAPTNARAADAFAQATDLWKTFGMPAFGDAPATFGHAWMTEVTQFFAQRLRSDADALVALGSCTGPVEIAEVQQRWLVEMGEAYAAAGARMMRLAVPPAGDGPRAPG